MSALIRLNLWLARLSGAFASLAVVAMMLIVATDAILRQAFNMRIDFVSVMVANYFMVAIAFLPLALAELQDRHISVDLIQSKLPASLRRVITLLVYGLAATMSAALTWTMWTEAMRRFSSGTVAVEDGASMAIWPSYFMLPIGFALLALTYLTRVLLGIAGAEEASAPLIGDGTADPAVEARS